MTIAPGDSDPKGFCGWPILLGILLCGLASFGQPAQQQGQVTGTIKNLTGQGLPGASVFLFSVKSNARLASVLTDPNGRYVLSNVLYGTYTLAATLTGFEQSKTKPLTVTSATTVVDFTLTPLAQGGDILKSGNVTEAEKPAPAFSPAGIQGMATPSGYSAAVSTEETSQVMDRVRGLDQEALSEFTPDESTPDCNQEADLREAAQANPESFGANHAMGIFYFGHSDFIQSVPYLKLASKARPADMNNSRDLALAYIGATQYSDAITLLQRIAEHNSRDPELLRLLALAYEASGNPQESAMEYVQAAGLDKGEQNSFECGIGLIGLGSADKAAKLFTSATFAHPGSAKLWMGLGIAQDLQQLKIDAIRSLLRAVDADPGYFPAYSFLANLSGTSTETDASIRKRLEALIVSNPENPETHYDYAIALWKQRILNPDASSAAEIESQLRLAIEKDPKMARAHFQLGIVYAASGNYVSATNELRETVELEPRNAEAHYRLMRAYRRDKQTVLENQEKKKFEAMHGNRASGEEGMGADIQRLIPQPSHQMAQAAPCHEANR